MLFHFKRSRLSEQQSIFAVLFFSSILSGCGVDVEAIANAGGAAMQSHTSSLVGYAVAGGSFLVATGHVPPALRRFALTIALGAVAFFMGNLSPHVFPWGSMNDGPLFLDVPDGLLITLLSVAGLLAVVNNSLTSGKSAGALDENSVRTWDRRLDRRAEKHSSVVRESLSRSVDCLEIAQDAMVVFNGEGVVLELNREAEIMFGWTRAHLVGQPVEVLIPVCELAGRPGQSLPFARFLATRIGASEKLKLRGVRKNGTTFAVEISSIPGRSGGAYAVIATIRTADEPVQASAELLRGAFACDRAADIARTSQAPRQRSALYASLDRRLSGLIEGSAPIPEVVTENHSDSFFGAQTIPSFQLPAIRFDHATSELAEIQWAKRWANAEKDARASAFSLLRVIDDMNKLPELDGPKPKLACSPTTSIQHAEDLCDRLFPASRVSTS